MTGIDELQAQIHVVARARGIAQDAKNEIVALRDMWAIDHSDALNDEDIKREVVVVEEARLRELTLAIFRETGDKHPAPEVNIREVEKLEYKPENGLYWAIQHNIALKLDTPAFEKIVKASPETFSSFVRIEKIATATIATIIQAEQK